MTPYTPPSNATSLSGYTGGAVPVVAPALFDADADIQRGTFGAVKRVTDRRTGVSYALKVPAQSGNDAMRATLQHEAQVLADIAPHASVTPLFAAVAPPTGPLCGLLLPLAPKGDLGQWLARDEQTATPLGYAGVLAAAAAVLDGLDHVHAAGYAHLDLKPENLLLFEADVAAPGAMSLADFDLARCLGTEVNTGAYGTLGYLPPELATPGVHVVAAAMDVHAFGALLLELAAQQRVRLNVTNAVYAAVTRFGHLFKGVVKALGGTRGCGAGGVPASLLAVAEACMAPDPATRPTVPQLRRHVAELADWHARKPELPRCGAAAAPPPAVAPAAASAWAQLPADYAAALRPGKLKPLVVPACAAGSAGGCASPTIGARHGNATPTATATHGEPVQPASPPAVVVQHLCLPSTLASHRAATRPSSASAASSKPPLTSGGGATARPRHTPVASSAQLAAEPSSAAAARSMPACAADSSVAAARDGGAAAGPSGRTPACSSACCLASVSRAAAGGFGNSTADPMPARSGGALVDALYAARPSSTGLCDWTGATVEVAPSAPSIIGVKHPASMDGPKAERPTDATATDPPATNSGLQLLADATATVVADSGELRRPHGRAPWARGESGEDCGAVAPLAAAALLVALFAGRSGSADAGQSWNGGAGTKGTEADMESADAALTDREVAACVCEEAFFARDTRRKGAKRRPAHGRRAAGKRRRRHR